MGLQNQTFKKEELIKLWNLMVLFFRLLNHKITQDEILNTFSKLDHCWNAGPDGIPLPLINDCSFSLSVQAIKGTLLVYEAGIVANNRCIYMVQCAPAVFESITYC